MTNNNTLIKELLDKKNLYLNEDATFSLLKYYTSFVFFFLFALLAISFFTTILESFLVYKTYFSFLEIISFVLGYTSYLYSFKQIKNKTILHYTNNPIILIGIFFPYFFNAALLRIISTRIFQVNLIYDQWALILIIIQYIFLNLYFQKKVRK